MSGTLVLILRILLALSLYSFLCLNLWMIWQDLRHAGFQSIRPELPLLRIEVLTPGADSASRAFAQAQVMVGRDPICEICLDDEAVSARHAKFSFHHAQWWIEDLHSTNGTSLNQLKLTTPVVLTNGDQVKCGQSVLAIVLDANATRPAEAHLEEQHD